MNKEDMDKAVESKEFVLFYLSRTQCGMCKSLKPKIERIADQYSNLETIYINLDNDDTIAGQYSLFTVPGILVFVNGRETIREARYMSVDEVDAKLKRISEMLQ